MMKWHRTALVRWLIGIIIGFVVYASIHFLLTRWSQSVLANYYESEVNVVYYLPILEADYGRSEPLRRCHYYLTIVFRPMIWIDHYCFGGPYIYADFDRSYPKILEKSNEPIPTIPEY